MSFAARLIHDLTHVAVAFSGTDDEYGQPAAGTPASTSVRGLVQPRTAREAADSRNAGVPIGDHVIFLAPMQLSERDHFLFAGDRFDIVAIRDYAFGGTPHLEVDTRRVGDQGDEDGS